MLDQALQYAHTHRDQALRELFQLLEIPSVSAQPDHQPDMQRAAEWLAHHMQQIGLQNIQVFPTAGHPVVYADWLNATGRPTILVYGHYDVQPPDPLDEWRSDPFKPDVRGDDLFARGAADDKGQLFIHLKAVEAYLRTSGKLPVNVKFIFEGEEEIGSEHLPAFIESHRDLLASANQSTAGRTSVAVISDSHIIDPGQPSIVYGLRGLTYMEVEIQGPAHDLHSGSYGGAIKNPIEALCEIIDALKDDQGRILIPGFYDKVRPLDPEERAELARVPFSEAQFRAETGIQKTWGEAGYTVKEQISARPTLEVNGFWGGYTGAGAKTVLPARAFAKVSMRLVPDQTSDEIAQLFQEHIERLTPDTVKVTVRKLHGGEGAIVDRHIPEMQAAAVAYERAFGQRPVYTREGGTIPVVADFQRRLGIPTILMGFGLPDDNLHAPNEKFHLPNFYKGIDTVVYLLSEMGLV
ncbi:MAG: peptidase M20 [Chloroflexi bacterium RBG_16_57_9]|nr:MAG: peptidase M20 [Chloroflexi bacterium RBG_16_57_9]